MVELGKMRGEIILINSELEKGKVYTHQQIANCVIFGEKIIVLSDLDMSVKDNPDLDKKFIVKDILKKYPFMSKGFTLRQNDGAFNTNQIVTIYLIEHI